MKTSLLNLEKGDTAFISEIASDGEMRRQLMEIGFIPGTEVEMISKGLFGGPLAVGIHGTRIALRRNEAEGIFL